jgi:hypothetical protein
VLPYLLPDGVAWWVHISDMRSPASRMNQSRRLAAVPGPRLTSSAAAARSFSPRVAVLVNRRSGCVPRSLPVACRGGDRSVRTLCIARVR